MLNLFQHLIKSMTYETLKRVQGDKLWFVQQAHTITSKIAKIFRAMGFTIIRNEKLKRPAVPCHAELGSASLNNGYFETLKQACPGVRPGFRVTLRITDCAFISILEICRKNMH